MDKALLGNGGPGLIRTVDRLEQAEAHRVERDHMAGKVTTALIIAALCALSAAFFTLVVMHADTLVTALGH